MAINQQDLNFQAKTGKLTEQKRLDMLRGATSKKELESIANSLGAAGFGVKAGNTTESQLFNQLSTSLAQSDVTQGKTNAALDAANKAKQHNQELLNQSRKNILSGTDSSMSQRVSASIGQGQSGALGDDITAGTKFGEAILGPEGLGKLGDSKNIQQLQERFQDLSKGFSDKETVAAKEAGLTSINAQQQAAERALQSRLGGAGVKGGAAGGQFRQLALGGLQQKANLERDLILADRDARVQGLSNLAEFTTNTEQFDIGQAAKEKNIAIQTGLGFGALGAAERGAKISAEAAKAAAAAGSGGSGKK